MEIFSTEKTYNFINNWLSLIVSKTPEERQPGFPQLEWNDYFNQHPECSFSILPTDFGLLTSNCVIYHAIGTKDKLSALTNALKSFEH